MKFNSIKHIGRSDFVNMGDLRLRQPVPSREIDMIDPFILLHHYGPYDISLQDNPFDLGPHPHRGFEPVTFLLQGEQLHRDSLGHESVVKAGDVQWTTAGRGIVHAERPTEDFVEKGGVIEGIQLWLNLPAAKKMMQANYQHAKHEDFSKKLVAMDYPTILCTSNNGQFRIYEQGSYSVARKDAGWNVWWKDKGYSESSAFHVGKCEIKDKLKD
jgi:redox-sensitive bicupin YhaK (pirin superfamily)